jgi:hypothetical protein
VTQTRDPNAVAFSKDQRRDDNVSLFLNPASGWYFTTRLRQSRLESFAHCYGVLKMEPERLSNESPDKPSLALESEAPEADSRTLKYHLLGPSLTKAGQDRVDQSKV